MLKPRLSLTQIFNMSLGFFGIQFGFALQNANASRIFETLGAKVEQIPILWVAAPLTGLLVQPIVGYFSDRTWTVFGRRRPYFFIGALCTTAALFAFPNSPVLWVAAVGLWVLDISINVTMEPFRAFVGDNLPHEQRTTGYAVQSVLIGIGAVIASALPYILTNWFDVSNTAPVNEIPDSVVYSFYCGGLVLFMAVAWTVFSSREYSNEQLAKFEENSSNSAGDVSGLSVLPHPFMRYGVTTLMVGGVFLVGVYAKDLSKELYLLGSLITVAGLMFVACHFLRRNQRVNNGFYQVIEATLSMPVTMRRLAVTQFFSWFAFFAMWIYTTSTVARQIFQAEPGTNLYNEAANEVSVLFATYNGVCAVVALCIPILCRLFGRKPVFAVFLICGGMGLMSVGWIENVKWLYLSMVGVGLAWSAILCIPYAMLSSALPYNRMGLYMGVFNFFIVLPQLLAASVLGFLVKQFFDSQALYALVLGGGSFIIGAASLYFVPDPKGEKGQLFSSAHSVR